MTDVAKTLAAFIMSLHFAASSGPSAASLALADLSELRTVVHDSYPAFESEVSAPRANAWSRDGLRQAVKLATKVVDEADGLGLLQFYLAGFKDPHLRLVTPARAQTLWSGFTLSQKGKEAVVNSVAAWWPAALPPMGASLHSCDGVRWSDYLMHSVGPFSDRREVLAARQLRLALLTNRSPVFPLLATPPMAECIFHVDGKAIPFAIRWQPTSEGLRRLFPPPHASLLLEDAAPNVKWLTAQTFAGIDPVAIRPQLDQLAQLTSETALVIDLRGNGGGDSFIGHEILRALLKGSMPPVSGSARWRASALAERVLEAHAHSARSRNDIDAELLEHQWRTLKAARQRGETWVADQGMPDSLPPRTGAPFSGPLLFLTDARCMSACLTFMNTALRHASAIHIGQETGANTKFTDTGHATLPSGAVVQIPLKEHMGMVLGDGAPLVPNFVFPGDIQKDPDVREWAVRLATQQLARFQRRALTP